MQTPSTPPRPQRAFFTTTTPVHLLALARPPSPPSPVLTVSQLSTIWSTGSIPIFLATEGSSIDIQDSLNVPTTPNPSEFAPSPVIGDVLKAPDSTSEYPIPELVGERSFDTFGVKSRDRSSSSPSIFEDKSHDRFMDDIGEEDVAVGIATRGTRHLCTPRRATPDQRADIAAWLLNDDGEANTIFDTNCDGMESLTPVARKVVTSNEEANQGASLQVETSTLARGVSIASSCFTVSAYLESEDGENAGVGLCRESDHESTDHTFVIQKATPFIPLAIKEASSHARLVSLPSLSNYSRPTTSQRPSPITQVPNPQRSSTASQQGKKTERTGSNSRPFTSPTLPPLPMSARSNNTSFTFASEWAGTSETASTAASSVMSFGKTRNDRQLKSEDLPLSLSFLSNSTIELWIDQEGFRSARPQMHFVRYIPHTGEAPSGSDKHRIRPRANSGPSRSRLGIGFGSTAQYHRKVDVGVAEFEMKKVMSWTYHHSTLGSAPLLRRLTVNEDESKDYLSRHGSLKMNENGIYSVSGTEDRDRLTWSFEYCVNDERSTKTGKISAGEKNLTPLRFTCSPELLRPDRGMKVKLLHVVRKSVSSNLSSTKLKPPSSKSPELQDLSLAGLNGGSRTNDFGKAQSIASGTVSNIAQAIVQVVSRPVTPKRPSTPKDRPKTPKRPITPRDILGPITAKDFRERPQTGNGPTSPSNRPETPKGSCRIGKGVMATPERETVTRAARDIPTFSTLGSNQDPTQPPLPQAPKMRVRASSHSNSWGNPTAYGGPMLSQPASRRIATPTQIKEWLSTPEPSRLTMAPSGAIVNPNSRLPVPTKPLTAMPPRSALRPSSRQSSAGGLPKRPSTSRV